MRAVHVKEGSEFGTFFSTEILLRRRMEYGEKINTFQCFMAETKLGTRQKHIFGYMVRFFAYEEWGRGGER